MQGRWNEAEEAMERLGAPDEDDRRVYLCASALSNDILSVMYPDPGCQVLNKPAEISRAAWGAGVESGTGCAA